MNKKKKTKLTNAIDGATTKNTDWGYVVPCKFGKPTNFMILNKDRLPEHRIPGEK